MPVLSSRLPPHFSKAASTALGVLILTTFLQCGPTGTAEAFAVDRRRMALSSTATNKDSTSAVNGDSPIVNGGNGDSTNEDKYKDDPTAFTIGIVGDLHIDPRKFEDYEVGRSHFLPIFESAKNSHGNVALVSLGDLGESKNCEHNPAIPSELYAGTTLCHETASDFLGSFGVPYEVIGGNHDLEGIDEFKTDAENLEVFLKCHGKQVPQFARQVAEKTYIVGLCSTIFRDADFTSHEVIVDDKQIAWFEDFLAKHPADEGWKIFVFSHAPPNGSGLRVLQENHVINGCCWLNHSDEKNCRKFIELVREHRSVKGWFSGHFHLGQDYQDSITFPTIDPSEGPYPNRGSCVFAQTSVMRGGTSRDGRQQSRLLRGNKDAFEICTIDHQQGGKIRVDATITYRDDSHEVGVYAHDDVSYQHDNYFKVYMPTEGDMGQICGAESEECVLVNESEPITTETKTWWRLSCGRVLGVLNGMLLEYDKSTLAPLGLVVSADELLGKRIAVLDSGIEECEIDFDKPGMEGAECADDFNEREQAVIMYEEDNNVTVIQPNEDGSYWRKIVRNKIARMKERRRELAALEFLKYDLGVEDDAAKEHVKSSWGPYVTTSGVAKSTNAKATIN